MTIDEGLFTIWGVAGCACSDITGGWGTEEGGERSDEYGQVGRDGGEGG